MLGRSFLIAIVATWLLCMPLSAGAQNPREEYKKIQRNLDLHKKKLENTKKVERSVLTDLRKVTAELVEIEKNLTAQRKKIKGIQDAISQVQGEIAKYNELIIKQGEMLKKRLRAMQRNKIDDDALLAVLADFDTAKTFRAIRYLQDITAYDVALINEYKDTVKKLADKKTKLDALHASLKAEEKKLTGIEQALKEKKAEREALLANVRQEKRTYQQMINELQEASQRLQKVLQELDQKEARKRTPSTKPSTPKQDKPDIDDTSPFAKLKGKLPWPVSGTVAVSYGSQTDPLFNLPIFRSGIHIKTPHGVNVKATAEGKVVYADEFKGYGKLVIISHGGSYHTLYGNLSKIFASKNSTVKEQETVGIVGDDPVIGTTGLYFEIRYKGKPLDPQQWLKK